MKKTIRNMAVLLIVLIAIIGLSGCGKAEDNETSKETEITKYKSYVVSCGVYDIGKTTKEVVASTEELEKIFGELKFDSKMKNTLSKYDDKYFKNKSLAILSVVSSNSADSIDVKKAVKDESNVKIEYEIDASSNKSGFSLKYNYYILVEVDKDINGIVYFANVK